MGDATVLLRALVQIQGGPGENVNTATRHPAGHDGCSKNTMHVMRQKGPRGSGLFTPLFLIRPIWAIKTA